MKRTIIGVFLLILILLLAGCGNSEPVQTLRVEEICDANRANPGAAAERYEGKVLRVTGRVHNIGESRGETFISLCGQDDVICGVVCFFPKGDSWKKRVELISTGDTITIVGKIDRFLPMFVEFDVKELEQVEAENKFH